MSDRPSVREPGSRALTDAEAPDFIEGNLVAVLAFVDASEPTSAKLLERFERVAPLFTGRAALASLDVRHSPLVAAALQVRRVPEMVVFVRGETADRIMGVPPEDIIVRTIEERLRATR